MPLVMLTVAVHPCQSSIKGAGENKLLRCREKNDAEIGFENSTCSSATSAELLPNAGEGTEKETLPFFLKILIKIHSL